MEVRNEKLDDDAFFEERKRVLTMWRTGREVDLDEAIEYHKKMPRHKNSVWACKEAKRIGVPLIHGVMGYTTIQQQIDLLLYLQNEGQADLLGGVLDSFSRTLQFETAERMLKEAEKTGKNTLNGFPAMAHGVYGCRKVLEAVDRPCKAGGGPATDTRLGAEIGLAGGSTSAGSSMLIAYENYTRNISYDEVVHNHQYNCRLGGYYQERGVDLLGQVGGGGHTQMPGTCPPTMAIAGSVIGTLITVAQGVKYVNPWSISLGNLIQDIADSVAMRKMVREYLDKFGYTDVEIFLTNGLIDGVYPIDFAQAIAEVLYAPIVSTLTVSESCLIRSLDEAHTIPTKENYVFSLRAVRMMMNLLKDQKIDLMNSEAVKLEVEEIEREVRAIVDRIIDLGEGDVVVGAKKGYEQGVLDSPTANNPVILGKIAGVRDARGAVRFLRTGNLPFSKEIKDFHREKIAERAKLINKEPDYDTMIGDLLSISRGSLLPPI